MTEVEYIIANFSERFADFRDKRIVLHGSRNYAEAIIDTLNIRSIYRNAIRDKSFSEEERNYLR